MTLAGFLPPLEPHFPVCLMKALHQVRGCNMQGPQGRGRGGGWTQERLGGAGQTLGSGGYLTGGKAGLGLPMFILFKRSRKFRFRCEIRLLNVGKILKRKEKRKTLCGPNRGHLWAAFGLMSCHFVLHGIPTIWRPFLTPGPLIKMTHTTECLLHPGAYVMLLTLPPTPSIPTM